MVTFNTYPFARRRRRRRIDLRVDAQRGLPRQRVAGERAGAGARRELHVGQSARAAVGQSGDGQHFCGMWPAHHTNAAHSSPE